MTNPFERAIAEVGDIASAAGLRSIARQRVTLYFDGGARPQPGPMEVAVVVAGHVFLQDAIGEGDNCTAEWMALRYAAAIAQTMNAQDVLFIGDARTIVEQALGNWRCRSPQLEPHLVAYSNAVSGIARVHVRHVPRSKNLAGIALARRHPR